MNSKVPKWMPWESAGYCFPNRSEELASQNKEVGGKRPCRTVENEGGVEEFLCLLERIEETKKYSKRRRSTAGCSGSYSAGIAVEDEGRMNIVPGMQQQAQGVDFVSPTPNYQGTCSPWKPSFQWEDFNINPVSVQTDLSSTATTKNSDSVIATAAVFRSSTEENHKGRGGSIQIGNGHLKTRSFLDIIADTPAGCADDMDSKEDVDAHLQLELRLFPI